MRAPPSEPSDPNELLKFAAKIRHSDAPRALQLVIKAQDNTSIPEAVRWRFRLLFAELRLDAIGGKDKGVFTAVETLLTSPLPKDVPSDEAAARIVALRGYIEQRRSEWDLAEELFDKAHAGMSAVGDDPCWKAELAVLHQAQTLRHQRKFSIAFAVLKSAKGDVDACSDKFWAALAPNAEGNIYLEQTYYENAIKSFQSGITIARQNNFLQSIPVPLANTALCYQRLGDYDTALRIFDETDAYYKDSSLLTKKQRGDWGWAKGHRARTYLALKRYLDAVKLYREAVQIAIETNDSDYLQRWRAELTALYIEQLDYKAAGLLNQQVLKQDNSNDFPVEAAALLNSARLARLQGDLPNAQQQLNKLEPEFASNADDIDPELMGQFHSERAQTLAALNHIPQASREFDAAIRAADRTRKSIQSDTFKLTYFLPSLNYYEKYIEFLADHNQTEDALRVAESSHARLLTEKLSISNIPTAAYDFRSIARAKHAVILSYSTSPSRSFMWVTTARASKMFSLPPDTVLRDLVKRHNEPILEERSLAEDQGGRELYDLLIGRVADLIPPKANVIVIPDGPLSDLNFETLIPPGAQPDYWLKSAVLTVSPSLTLLLPQAQHASYSNSVLALGAAIQVDPNLPQLGNEEPQLLKKIYGDRCKSLESAAATPTGFMGAHPERWSLIHISAHAIANPQSPLDSYIALSPEANNEYKLYAHDLAKLKLNASLVTLSACQSAGAKNVPGEGLVGLTWAVLSTGAQNVVASLWPVAAPATARLMQRFYTHLSAGESPDQALHSAKMEMAALHATAYEWAAFQLYSR